MLAFLIWPTIISTIHRIGRYNPLFIPKTNNESSWKSMLISIFRSTSILGRFYVSFGGDAQFDYSSTSLEHALIFGEILQYHHRFASNLRFPQNGSHLLAAPKTNAKIFSPCNEHSTWKIGFPKRKGSSPNHPFKCDLSVSVSGRVTHVLKQMCGRCSNCKFPSPTEFRDISVSSARHAPTQSPV